MTTKKKTKTKEKKSLDPSTLRPFDFAQGRPEPVEGRPRSVSNPEHLSKDSTRSHSSLAQGQAQADPRKKDGIPRTLECPVRDMKGKKIDTVTLDAKVFDGEVNMPLIHQVVTMYRANQREGSASTKTRGEVSGGGKKPWRQKGTGRARTSSIRNPIWRHGGTIFGPKPRDFSFTVPQKMRRSALRSSLNEKHLGDSLIVVDSIRLDKPKTKLFFDFLRAQGLAERESTVVVFDKLEDNVKRASRNIPKVSIAEVASLNAFLILASRRLIIELSSLKQLMKVLK